MRYLEPMRLQLDSVYMGEVLNGAEFRAAGQAFSDAHRCLVEQLLGRDEDGARPCPADVSVVHHWLFHMRPMGEM